jgi:hypothetical protein
MWGSSPNISLTMSGQFRPYTPATSWSFTYIFIIGLNTLPPTIFATPAVDIIEDISGVTTGTVKSRRPAAPQS